MNEALLSLYKEKCTTKLCLASLNVEKRPTQRRIYIKDEYIYDEKSRAALIKKIAVLKDKEKCQQQY